MTSTSEGAARSTLNGLNVVTFTSIAELASARQGWDGFVERSGGDIYFTVDWLESWWKYYGRGRELRCFSIHEGDRAVAALPFFIESQGPARLGIRICKFVGADFTIPIFSPAIDPSRRAEIVAIVLEDLFAQAKCDLVSLSPLSGTDDLVDAVRAFCADENAYGLLRNDSASPHTTFALPETFEMYLKALSKQARSNFRRDMRILSADQPVEHRVVKGSEAVALYDQFVSMHREQWRPANKLGHFGDWPQSEAFNRDLVVAQAKNDRVRFYELSVGGETISLQFGFVLSNRFYWRLPARKVGEKWDKVGIGRVALVHMIEALIAEGITWIEAGPGHYDYKVKHGAAEHPARRLLVSRARGATWLKAGLLLAWSQCLNFAYYRLWFLKIAPRFVALQGPLWRVWIRTRF